MATATQPKSSSAAVDVQNVAVENLSLESNSGKKASKWGLSKVFTTAFRRPSLGALSTSLPAANSEGEGVGTRVSTSTPPLAVKDTLALTASAQEVPSAPTDTDARPDDSAGWVVRTGDDSSSSNGSEAASSDDDYDGELSPLPQKELSERRRDDTPLRLKGAPGSEYNHNDEGGDEVVIAKDTPPHVSANAGDANDRDGYEAWNTPPPRTNPVPSRLPSLDQSPGTLMGTRSSSSRRGSTTGSSTASGEAAPEVISRGSGVVVDDSADQDGQCGHDGDDDDDDEGEDRVVRVLLGRDESTARGLSRVTEGSREYASVSSVRSARFDSSSSSRGGNVESSLSPSRRGSSSSSGGSSFLGRESSAMRGLSASVERGSATAEASTPAGGGAAGGASGHGKGGSSSADKAKDTNSRNSQSESRALSLSRANPTGDARTDGRRSPFVPHKPEGSAAAAALFDATRPSGGDERWEDRSGADHVSNSNSSSASSSSSSVNLASDLAAEEGRGNGTGGVEHTRAEEGNERSWSDDDDDDRVVVLNDQLFPSNNDEDDDDDDDRAHRYAFHDLSSRSPRRERSQPRERRSDEREDRSASGSEGRGAFVFGRNGGRTHSSSSDEEDEDGRDRGGGSAAEVGAGGEGIGTFRRRGGDDNAWDCDDVGRDALSSDEGELEEEDGVDEDAASAAAAAQAAVKTLLSDTSLTVAQKMATLKTQHANGDLESIGGANALTSASQLLHAAPHLSKAADDGDLAVPAVEDDALGQTSNDRNVGDGNDEGEERERSEAFGEGEELIVAASSSSSEEENEEEEDEDAMIARMEAEYEAANASSSRWLGESSSSSSGGGGNLRELQQHDDDEEEALRALLASEAAANAPPEGSASPNSYSSGSGGNEVSGGEEGGEEGAWAGPPAAGKGAFFNEESDIEGEGDGDENSSDWEGSPSHGSRSTEEGVKGRRRPRNGGEEERGDHHDDDGFGSTEEEEEEESELGVLQSVNSSRAGNSSNLDQSRSNISSNISSNERMGQSSPGDVSRISPPPPPRSASADTAASGAGNDRPRNSSSSDRDPRSRSLSYGSTKLEPQPARTSIPLEISSGEEDGLVDDSTEWEDDGDGAGLQNFSQGAGSAFERYRVQHVGSSSAGVSASGSSSSGLVVLSDSASVGGESSDDEIQGADGGAANAGGEGLGGYWAVLALICPGTRQEQEPPRSSYQEQPSLDWDGESSDGPDSENDDDDDDEGGSTRGSRFAFGGLGPVGQSRSDNPGRPSRGGANSFLGGCLPPPQQPQHRSGGGFVWPWQRTARS